MQETRFQSLGGEYSLEKEMATHLGILVWRIPWAEEPGGLQSTWSKRVRHYLATEYAHKRLYLQKANHIIPVCKIFQALVFLLSHRI